MQYSKPEVTKLASALEAVRGGKADPVAQDSGRPHKTIGAYEADE